MMTDDWYGSHVILTLSRFILRVSVARTPAKIDVQFYSPVSYYIPIQ